MKGDLNLEIKNVRSIKNANIEINRINVIGGVNGSGKSTISKIFYSFLKANSEDRRVYLHQEIINCINHHIQFLIDQNIDENDIPEKLTLEDDYYIITKKYEKISEIFKNNDQKVSKHREELSKIILDKFKFNLNKLEEKGLNVDNFSDCSSVKDIFSRDIFPNFKKLMVENDLKESLNELYDLNSEYSNTSQFNSNKMSLSVCKIFIDYYFNKEDGPLVSDRIMKIVLSREYFRGLKYNTDKSDSIINFFTGVDNKLNAFDYYYENEFINQVFYIDNVSILDFEENNSKFMPLHKSELIEKLYLRPLSINKNEIDDNVRAILDKIEEIINGEYLFEGHIFNTNIPSDGSAYINFTSSKDEEPKIALFGDNISSGIKQIGIIQILLLNNKLKKNSYLILDEPEVNLHPRWQFKFAEILVLLAKELNVTLYINSHSPMFIESLDAFCEYYDMEEEVNYYLAVKSDERFRYDFTKINSNKLYKIYDNLGSSYKLINQLKLRKKFNK